MSTQMRVLFLLIGLVLAGLPVPAAADIAAAVERVQDGVVMVRGDGRTATGWFIAEGGLVVTSYNALAGSPRLEISVKGERTARAAQVCAIDTGRDLLLLQAAPPAGKVLAADPAHVFRSGEPVFLIGHPELGPDVLGWTAASGIVSNPARKVKDRTFIQTSAPVNPGNAGAPLFDGDGKVIGIISSKVGGLDRVAFALPVSEVLDFLAKRETPPFRVKGTLADWEKGHPEVSAKAARSEVVRIGIPSIPEKLLWHAGKKRLLVLDKAENSIHLVDPASAAVEKSVVAGSGPTDMDCVSGDDVVVADVGGISIRWVDLGSGKTVRQISLQQSPVAVCCLDDRTVVAVLSGGGVVCALKSGQAYLMTENDDEEEEVPSSEEIARMLKEGKITLQQASELSKKSKQNAKKPKRNAPPPLTSTGLEEVSPGEVLVAQAHGKKLTFSCFQVRKFLKLQKELEELDEKSEKELEPERKALDELKPRAEKAKNFASYNIRVDRYNKQINELNARIRELLDQKKGCVRHIDVPDAEMSGGPGESEVLLLKGGGKGRFICGRGLYGMQTFAREGDLKRYPRSDKTDKSEKKEKGPPLDPEEKERQDAVGRFLESLANARFASSDGRYIGTGERLYLAETLTSGWEWPFPVPAGAFDREGKTLFLANFREPEILMIDFDWLKNLSDR